MSKASTWLWFDLHVMRLFLITSVEGERKKGLGIKGRMSEIIQRWKEKKWWRRSKDLSDSSSRQKDGDRKTETEGWGDLLTCGKSIKLLTTFPTEPPYSQTWPSPQPECLTDWRKEGVWDMKEQLIDRQSEKAGLMADHNQARRWTACIEEGRPNTSQKNHSRIALI